MKKFFTELTEVLTTVALSSCFIYLLFKYIIGTPEDIKTIGSKVNNIEHATDTIKHQQIINNEAINGIRSNQIDLFQRVYDNNYLIRKNNDYLEEIQQTNRQILRSINSEK